MPNHNEIEAGGGDDGGAERGRQSSVLLCVFHGNGGYPAEEDHARRVLVVGREYEITTITMHSSVTYIGLKGERHTWNTALFHVDHDELVRRVYSHNEIGMARRPDDGGQTETENTQ